MEHKTKLTSAEIAGLWNQCLNDSLAACTLGYFSAKAEDREVKSILDYAVELTEKHQAFVIDIFREEDLMPPAGFDSKDVDFAAPRLFSDSFALSYLKEMAKTALQAYGTILALTARADVRDYFESCLDSLMVLSRRITELMLAQGIYIRPPYVAVEKKREEPTRQSFLGGLLGEPRPMMVGEAAFLAANLSTSAVGTALMAGLAQTARLPELREYLYRGSQIAKKHGEVLAARLAAEDVGAPVTWDAQATASTAPPFSDRLMALHANIMGAGALVNYGISVAASMRADLTADYLRLAAEVLAFQEDGMNLMIARGWLESPPQVVSRRELALGR